MPESTPAWQETPSESPITLRGSLWSTVRYDIQKLQFVLTEMICNSTVTEDLTVCWCLCSYFSRLRPAPLPAALSDILGDLHLLPWVFHHRHPRSHSSHVQTLLCPEEERLQQPVSRPEISQEHSSEETGNTSVFTTLFSFLFCLLTSCCWLL